MADVTIKISGPGLVVNGPAAVIFKALTDAGFEVELPEFLGQHQFMPKEGWPDNEVTHLARPVPPITLGDGRVLSCKRTAKIEVDPQPWGG
jgi:hypothetical protein